LPFSILANFLPKSFASRSLPHPGFKQMDGRGSSPFPIGPGAVMQRRGHAAMP
jgi:hypothetical protein